jgi:peptidoglycan/LPS O-acetylase OafA/YrhL
MTGTGGPAPATRAFTGQQQHHQQQHDYRPALDGLRAIAVTAVLLFHVDRLPGGNLGVDAFFVLSGWLITWRLLAEADASDNSVIRLRQFWGARVRRLFPASVTVIVVVAVVWSLSDIAVPSLRRDLVWALGWSSNWGTISGGGDYWAHFGEPSPITHFWSLAIEEQFYLVWPLVIALLVRAGVRRRRTLVGAVSASLAIASIAFMAASFDPARPTATYMNTFARAHSLLIGAAAAAITVSLGPRLRGAQVARRAMPAAAAVAIAIVLASSQRSEWLFSWGFPVFALAMAVIVVAAADGAGTRVLASPPLRWIGDRSYGIYLWHWPVILLLSRHRSPIGGVALDIVRIGLSIGLAAASYTWLESPIRRRRRAVGWWAPGLAVSALVTSIVVVTIAVPSAPASATPSVVTLPPATATMAVPATASAPLVTVATTPTTETPNASDAAGGRDSPPSSLLFTSPDSEASPALPTVVSQALSGQSGQSVSVDVGSGSSPVSPAHSAPRTVTVEAVIDVEPQLPVRVLVAGDSTAVQLADVLLPYASAHGDQIVAGNASFPGCGLTAANDGRKHELIHSDGSSEMIDLNGCTDQWTSIVTRVSSAEQIDIVLVEIGAWDGVDIYLADGRVVSVADPVGHALVANAYRQFVIDVQSAGARVVWITPPDVRLHWNTVPAPANDPKRWSAIRQIIDGLSVDQIDLRSWLTEQGLDGPAGRPDGVHLAPDVNVRFVTELVAPSLVALAR